MTELTNKPPVSLTNNVFYRVPFTITNNAVITCYNNLFYGTTNYITNITVGGTTSTVTNATPVFVGTNTAGIFQNNVFDGVNVTLAGVQGYNAYLHGASDPKIQSSDYVGNFTWQAGPLGAYYQPYNSPLLSNGSTNANSLDLCHYTVLLDEMPDGTNFVSRGYHYVALGSNGLPVISDTNGIADYLADPSCNGSGGVGTGEPNYVYSVDSEGEINWVFDAGTNAFIE